MLENGAWLKHAQHANRCAPLLANRLANEADLRPAHPVEANAVFVTLPENFARGLRDRGWEFYDFIGGGYRFMCSWQTTEADINALMADVAGNQKDLNRSKQRKQRVEYKETERIEFKRIEAHLFSAISASSCNNQFGTNR